MKIVVWNAAMLLVSSELVLRMVLSLVSAIVMDLSLSVTLLFGLCNYAGINTLSALKGNYCSLCSFL